MRLLGPRLGMVPILSPLWRGSLAESLCGPWPPPGKFGIVGRRDAPAVHETCAYEEDDSDDKHGPVFGSELSPMIYDGLLFDRKMKKLGVKYQTKAAKTAAAVIEPYKAL